MYVAAIINDVHIQRALVDIESSLNLISTSTLNAARISRKKIQGVPMEVTWFGGAAEYTIGHIQLVLKVGPIVALARFHVMNTVVSYHALLGRLWLHKHKLVPFTYHQCVKGRLNGKPIRIPAYATLFDESEVHYVEAAFYDEMTPTEEGLISKVVGTRLPRWEVIKDKPDMDLRKLLEQKRKRKDQRGMHLSVCVSSCWMDAQAINCEGMRGPTTPSERVPELHKGAARPLVAWYSNKQRFRRRYCR